MKNWLLALVLAWNGSTCTVRGAVAPEPWPGVVAITGGSARGSWKPMVRKPVAPDAWQVWEQMEKMSITEQLRREASPKAVMQPDDKGQSLLVVAPGAGLSGYVVDAAAGRVEILGAAVENSALHLGKGGRVVVRHSLLSGFHVFESPSGPGGGEVEIHRCAVTGIFGGGYWSGQQHWRIEDCHFKDSQLPWIKAMGAGAVREGNVLRCHFENCFIPEGFLLNCVGCTFDGCIIGAGDAFSGGKLVTFDLDESGAANTLLPRNNGWVRINVRKRDARPPFWAAWTLADAGGMLASLMASPREVEPVVFTGKSTLMPLEASQMEGKAFRRLDAAGQLSFAGTTVKVQDKGEDRGDASFQITPDRLIEWTETVVYPVDKSPQAKPASPPRQVIRRGVLSPDNQWLIVGGTDNNVIGSTVRIFQQTPAMMWKPASRAWP
ncbi:MAG: hypothetical protein V4675_07900 [Verrucomicrobiota bacterium]